MNHRTANHPAHSSARCLLSTWSVVLCLALMLPGLARAKEKTKEPGTGKKAEAATTFLKAEGVPSLKLEIAPAELDKLRKEAKTYVKATLTETGQDTYADAAVKLKGSAGSFQEVDERPAFTVNMDRFKDGLNFHGLDKFHLNNSVQDETYLHEALCTELFRKAGIPAPRVCHARVWLNGKDLGLYVLKEGFDKNFLKQHFENTKGNLYDGGFVTDVDGDLDRDEGKGEENRQDLKALVEACLIESLDARWPRIEAVLNVDAFLTFIAMEYMTGHWDGYCQNTNNYRLYFDPGDGDRAHFLPHGMDQMFGDPGASVLSAPKGLVATAVMQNPVWRKKYREQIKVLLPLFNPPEALLQEVTRVAKKLQPTLRLMGPDALTQYQEKVKELSERLTSRAQNLQEQALAPEPQPLAFDDQHQATLEGWGSRLETDHGNLEDQQEEGKPRLLMIECGEGEATVASWRTSVLLAAGKYRFEGKAKSKNLKPVEDDRGTGGGLRISGESRKNELHGTAKWTKLSFEFTVENERQVELVAELRASQGQIWFEADSLKLVRVKAP